MKNREISRLRVANRQIRKNNTSIDLTLRTEYKVHDKLIL